MLALGLQDWLFFCSRHGLANLSWKRPDGIYFTFCGPDSHSYSTAILAKAAVEICKWKGKAMFQQTLKAEVMGRIWPTDWSLPTFVLSQSLGRGESF